MPSVLDRILGRKTKPEAVKHEEPIPSCESRRTDALGP